MTTSNPYVRSASIALPSADGCRSSSVAAFGCVLVVISAYCFCPSVFAQTPDFRTGDEPNQSWTATTDVKAENLNPARIIESHSWNTNHTVDKRSVEIRGVNGYLEPYQDIEREILQADDTTMRTITRTFVRDVNGRKTLVQVIEEQKHILFEGDSNIVRTTSIADLNGTLQPVRSEIVETKSIGADMEETNTTVMLPSFYGGFAPVMKGHELQKSGAKGAIESQETMLLLDGAGNWQAREMRQSTIRQVVNNRNTDEHNFRRDAEDKLSEFSHVVRTNSESAAGQTRSVMEIYSLDIPGTTPDGSLHLVERSTSTHRTSVTGEQLTEKQADQVNPGDPGLDLRVSVLVDGRMVPGPSGQQSTVIIRERDSNGNFGVVSVETTKSDRIPTIQVQQTPAEKP
ncbi:MAG: hypothetical protein ABSG70_11665 [Terriglobales bacterium]|jgi:hypothetical protein